MRLYNFIVLAILLSALAACGAEDGAPAGGGQRPPTEVAVITVQTTTATLSQEYTGRLRAWRRAEVRARVEGIVEKRFFSEGATVQAGEVLYQIEDSVYRTALAAAEAEVEAARLAMARVRKLVKKNLSTPEALEEARARYRQAQATLARARRDLDNTRVPAPITGRIARSEVTEGALVGRGEATLLTTIEQIDPLYVDIRRPATEVRTPDRNPTPGSTAVTLLLDDGTPYPQRGEVLFSESRVDPATDTVFLRARIANPEHALLPGAFVRAQMTVAELSEVIRVPQRAVQVGRKGLRVLVVSPDGKVAPRPVKALGMDGGDFLVNAGLSAGEQVIVEGLQKVRPGATVKAVPWQASQPHAAPGH